MTQAEFAEVIGVSPYTVEAWFRPRANQSWRGVRVTILRLIEQLQKNGLLSAAD